MSLANGLFGLNQAMGRPAQLSQSQQGLLGGLGEALNPRPQMDVGDPASMRQAAQHAMQKGDTLEGQRLMQEAAKTEQRITEGKIKNIKRTYAAAESAGKLDQFKATMVEAGEADIIAQIEEEKLNSEVKRVTGEATLDSAEAREIAQQYASAQTEEGRQAVVDHAMKTGRGDVIKKIQQEEADAKYQATVREANLAKVADAEAQRKIDSFPIPDSREAIEKQMETVPAEHRDYYMQRAQSVVQARKNIATTLSEDKIKTVDLSDDSEMLAMAGWDKQKYDTVAGAFGKKSANMAVRQAALKAPKIDKPTVPSGTMITSMTKAVEAELTKQGVDAGWGYFDKSAEEMGNVELMGQQAAYLVAGGMEPADAINSVLKGTTGITGNDDDDLAGEGDFARDVQQMSLDDLEAMLTQLEAAND